MDRNKLDEFTRSYIETALWSSNDESTPNGGEPMDKNYDISDIHYDTLIEMANDCKKFMSEHADDIYQYNHRLYTANEMAGHDLWLTRNNHGCGFWDREEHILPKEAAMRLTKAAESLGEYHLYVGDNGMIYGTKG